MIHQLSTIVPEILAHWRVVDLLSLVVTSMVTPAILSFFCNSKKRMDPTNRLTYGLKKSMLSLDDRSDLVGRFGRHTLYHHHHRDDNTWIIPHTPQRKSLKKHTHLCHTQNNENDPNYYYAPAHESGRVHHSRRRDDDWEDHDGDHHHGHIQDDATTMAQ